MKRLIFLAFTFFNSGIALGAALDPWTTWATSEPYVSKQVPPNALVMRGIGTDAYYVVEVDPSTGAIPVDIGGAGITVDYSGVPGDAAPGHAAYVGGTDGTDLRGIKTNTTGNLVVTGLGTAGTATSGVMTVQGIASMTPVQTTGTGTAGSAATGVSTVQGIASMTPLLTTGTGTAGSAATGVVTVQGITSMTPLLVNGSGSTQPVSGTVAVTQSTSPWVTAGGGTAGSAATGVSTVQGIASMTPLLVSGTGTAGSAASAVTTIQGIASMTPVSIGTGGSAFDTNVGTAGAQTVRVIEAGHTIANNVVASNNYASTAVTTSAYVQLISSTANQVNLVCVSNSSGSIIKLATGAALSEVDKLYIPAGGSGCFPNTIATSTRVSLEALDATASVGYFLFTGIQ